MNGPSGEDLICIGDLYSQCYKGGFMLVTSVTENYWLNWADFSNIGGMLGVGYKESGSGFWASSGATHPYFSLSLAPSANDWACIPDAPK